MKYKTPNISIYTLKDRLKLIDTVSLGDSDVLNEIRSELNGHFMALTSEYSKKYEQDFFYPFLSFDRIEKLFSSKKVNELSLSELNKFQHLLLTLTMDLIFIIEKYNIDDISIDDIEL